MSIASKVHVESAESTACTWSNLYRVGGAAALIAGVFFRRNLGAEISLDDMAYPGWPQAHPVRKNQMRNATKTFTSTLGAIMALAGLEHGIGEMLQGSVAPSGMLFPSWPGSAFFRSLGGEPAMTIIPNLLVTGILASLFSLVLLVWATRFVQRKNGGLIMMLLWVVLLLVGGGIFPPILGIMIGAVATRINAPLTWGRTHLTEDLRRFLGKLWPWFFTTCIIGWLLMFPGLAILGYFFGVNNPTLVIFLLIIDIGTLLLTIFSGFAHDIQKQSGSSSGEFDLRAI